jgi:hypothetical protein
VSPEQSGDDDERAVSIVVNALDSSKSLYLWFDYSINNHMDTSKKSVRYLNGYRLLYKPDYQSSMNCDNWKGWVYEHIFIMESHLGRKMGKDEVIHHLDCNRSNNRRENLIVLNRGDHAKIHSWMDTGAFVHESYEWNGLNSGDSKVTEPTYCEVCFQTLQEKQKHTCSKECAGERKALNYQQHRERAKPTKSELKRDMEHLSWLVIGRKYSVSDNGARKWARKYGLL